MNTRNMKGQCSRFVLSCVVTLFITPALAQSDGEGPTDRIIVKYKNSAPLASRFNLLASDEDELSQRAGKIMRHFRRMRNGAHVMKLDRVHSANELRAVIARLKQDSNVEYVEPDRVLKPLFTPNDSHYGAQWHYYEATGGLNLPQAWDTATGEGVVVAVVDTGVLPHADLTGNLLPGYDMISDTFVSQDGDGRDADASDAGDAATAGICGAGKPTQDTSSSWHGTHVAGTVAATTNNGSGVAGVAFDARILPVRVMGRCGGYTSDIADGIVWAAGGSVNGTPANANPAQVINLSLGGPGGCDNTTRNAINTARGLGATIVVAAGNDAINASSETPANCAGVVTVAATNRNGGRASYSNYGDVVDVAAPGGQLGATGANGVLSTLNDGSSTPGGDAYAYYQGTSMAAPHVAGAAALLYSITPGITPDQVEVALKSSARPFPAACSQCGAGIVDAAALVSSDPNAGEGDELTNGTPVTNLSGAQGSQSYYRIEVPAGASNLQIATSGGSGDVDLYVQWGSQPTTGVYDCRPYRDGNAETCTIGAPKAGTYYVMLRGYAAYNGLTLSASFSEGGSSGGVGGLSETNLSAPQNTWLYFTVEVPAGSLNLSAAISGGSGDADLYLHHGAQPTPGAFTCRPYKNGNEESCSIDNPQPGTWHIGISAYQAFSGLSLDVNYHD